MSALKRYLRIYMLIEGQYIKSRLQYRADFIISGVGMLLSSLTTAVVFWALLHSIHDLYGWSLNQLLFIYAFYLLAVCPAQILFDHIWVLRDHVMEGTFIKYYLRPLNMMFYYMSEAFDIKGLFQFLLGLAIFFYSSINLGLIWTPMKLLLLLASLFGSALVIIALMVLAACSAFWIVDSLSVVGLIFKLREFAQYPITIFNGFFRFFFTYLIPTGFVAFYPAQLFLHEDDISAINYATLFMGIGFFLLAVQVWKRGVDRYAGTGS